jgi:uncharacterized surface protein with fasciclin (FAS1) repeats
MMVKNKLDTVMKAFLFFLTSMLLGSCVQQQPVTTSVEAEVPVAGGQSNVNDSDSQPDVVKIAVGSSDHTTLVAALKAAEYVDVLSNAGPFTVFAPTNAAFDKLPAGTVETLLKPENKDKLRTILEYHVYVGVLTENMIQDGMKLNQVSLHNVMLSKKDNKIAINGANVLGSARGSNGIVYIIDNVLLPPEN